MCGIVGYVGKKSVVPVIIEGLRKLEYRGYDSAGIAVGGVGDGLQIRRAEGKLRNLEEAVIQTCAWFGVSQEAMEVALAVAVPEHHDRIRD